MTTLEFMKKCLRKTQISLEHVKKRPTHNAREINALNEKIEHYEKIIRLLEEGDPIQHMIDLELSISNDGHTLLR